MPDPVPIIDLAPWFSGDTGDRAAVAGEVDQALRTSGFELNHDAIVESLPAPIDRASFPPVVAHEYLASKLDAITVR